MFDIAFYMAFHEYKTRLMAGNNMFTSQQAAYDYVDSCRSTLPVVFNLESTNSCNMRCGFCPRTTLMTRPVKTMAPDVFMRVALQLTPHPAPLWQRWLEFAERTYGIPQNEQSENAFFLYILPRVVVLHGYGDPLLDPRIADYVGILHRADIPTYFSCNPANIRPDRIQRVMENGLDYLKFSVDSISAPARGEDVWLRDFDNILAVLDMKEKHGYQTQIIITMIDLGQKEYDILHSSFAGMGVYIYQKSPDQAWLTGKDKPGSIHWSEFCQFPWSSMSIHSDGLAVSCSEDYEDEIVLGDARIQTLKDIWNGAEYAKFRHAHFDMPPGLHCTERCDMRLIGEFA